MGLFALCTGYQAEPFRDGENAVSQSKVSHGNNDYSVMNCFAPGIEINPADGEFLVVDRLNDSSSFMVSVGGINQNIAPSCARGERKIYSVAPDGKSAKAFLLLKNDGSIQLECLDSAKKLTMKFGTTSIEFSISGMKVITAAGSYNFLTHTHPTPNGPSGPTKINS